MKRFLLVLPIVLITLIAVLLAAPHFIDWNQYKPQAQRQIQNTTGLEIEFNGDLGLAIFPEPYFYAEDVVVTAPHVSTHQKLAELERLDIHVNLGALLSGEIRVSSFGLIKPAITIANLEAGQKNWQTPKIRQLMDRKTGSADKPAEAGPGLVGMVSFDNVSIEKGQITYIDQPAGQRIAVQNINLTLEAETLQGPFEGSGNFEYAETDISFEGTAGAFGSEDKSTSLNVALRVPAQNFKLSFAGVAAYSPALEIQGETALTVSGLSKHLPDLKLDPDKLSAKGFLTADTQKFSYKNAHFKLAEQAFTGNINGTISPLSLRGALAAESVVDLDKILPVSATGPAQFDAARPGAFLPENALKAVPAALDIELSLPGLIYKNHTFKSTNLDLSLRSNEAGLNFSTAGIPGGGQAQGALALKPGPALSLSVRGEMQNPAQTVNVLTQTKAPPFIAQADEGAFDISAFITPERLEVKKSTLTLDGRTYRAAGTLENKILAANIAALGGQADLRGSIEGKTLQNINISASHPNMSQAMKAFGAAPGPLFEKPIDISMKLRQDGPTYAFSDIEGQFGGAAMKGNLKFETGQKPVAVSGALNFGSLSLTSASPGGSAGPGRWSKQKIEAGWLSAAALDLELAAKSLRYNNWNLDSPDIALTLKGGVMDIKRLEAGMYGGRFSASGTLRAPQGPLQMQGQAAFQDVLLEELVRSFVGTPVIRGQGRVNLALDLKTAGDSQTALVNSLQGSGTTTGRDLVLQGFDLNRFARAISSETKPGDTLLGLWKTSIKGGSTAFDTMDGAFDIQKGIVHIQKLDLTGPRIDVDTQGQIDLPAWRMATAHKMTVKDRKDVPPFTVRLSGPLNNPASTFAEGALKDYFSRKLNRKLEEILTDKLGLPSQEQQQEPAESSQEPAPTEPSKAPATPEEALQDILKGLIQ